MVAANIARNTTQSLDQLRQQGDPFADGTIDAIFNEGRNPPYSNGVDAVNRFLGALVLNDDVLFAKGSPPLSHPAAQALCNYMFQGAQLPAWADNRLIQQGQDLYARYGLVGFSILGCASLPEAYATDYAAKVLGTTQQLEKHVRRRIFETSQFVIDVTTPGGLTTRAGRGIASALKVRLMHAAIRRLIQAPPPPGAASVQPRNLSEAFINMPWSQAKMGMPIHQVAMSMAILSFSYIVLRSLRKLGVQLETEEENAYLHLWNVIGHVMGVEDVLLPPTMEHAQELYQLVWPPDTRPSPQGRALEKTLLDYLASFVPLMLFPLRHLPRILSRHLMSDEVCAALGLELSWPEQIGLTSLEALSELHLFAGRIVNELGIELRFANRVASRLLSFLTGLPHLETESFGQLPASRLLAEWLFRRMAEDLQGFRRGGDRHPFKIPKELATGNWRLR